MKSNLPRSAVCVNLRNESNSMWLPAAGSLHTVVLFTPGKCAARWICLVMVFVSSGGVAVGGAGQAEQPPERARLVAGAEQAPALQLRYQAFGEVGQVMRQGGRAQPEAGQPGGLPVLQQVGQPGGGAGEDGCVAGVLGPGALVETLPARGGGRLGLVEEDDQVAEDV